MRILILGAYPYPGHSYSGIFNERCVAALRPLCESVEVVSPRPYAPPFLSFVPRWKAYATAARYEVRDGVAVYRPATPVIPRIGKSLWWDLAPFLWCRRTARRMHRHVKFNAILSFDLLNAGGIAWRLGRELRIPAAGWAFGGDLHSPKSSPLSRVAARAAERLDLVFYQSHELLERAAALLHVTPERMAADRHIVLPHGIPEPPPPMTVEGRNEIRRRMGISRDQLMMLNLGRIVRPKGIFELLEAFSFAAEKDPRLVCAVVGSNPAFDETATVEKKLEQKPRLKERVKLFPSSDPAKVWDYYYAADIFAFASHEEGMPNSLLEAMATGLPAIAFAIPPVMEIEDGTGGIVTVPPLDSAQFGEAILRLAASPDERVRIGEKGKARVMDRFMVRKNMVEALRHINWMVEQHNSSQSYVTKAAGAGCRIFSKTGSS